MYFVVRAISRSIFPMAILLAVSVSAQTYLSNPLYQQELYYGAATGYPASINSGLGYGPPAPAYFGYRSAAGGFHQPLLSAETLFTPNTVQQPAETVGQIENYNKALQEEAQEAEKEANALGWHFQDAVVGPKSYVDVRISGHKNYNYGYTV